VLRECEELYPGLMGSSIGEIVEWWASFRLARHPGITANNFPQGKSVGLVLSSVSALAICRPPKTLQSISAFHGTDRVGSILASRVDFFLPIPAPPYTFQQVESQFVALRTPCDLI
jgi:hypothetical protein